MVTYNGSWKEVRHEVVWFQLAPDGSSLLLDALNYRITLLSCFNNNVEAVVLSGKCLETSDIIRLATHYWPHCWSIRDWLSSGRLFERSNESSYSIKGVELLSLAEKQISDLKKNSGLDSYFAIVRLQVLTSPNIKMAVF